MATLAMVVLAIGGLAVAPADADDTIRTQWYTAPTGLDELKARGLDGTGVTIAIIATSTWITTCAPPTCTCWPTP